MTAPAASKDATGKVYLVGAGPGDPKLLTLRAAELLGACDIVMVDQLVNPEVLAHVRPDARVLDVGKRAGKHAADQDEINMLLVAYARRGHVVVRLKGGDPFVFGRGGEEAEALATAGVPFEIVPGVSSGIAAAAYAGIPLTHRDHASRVTFATGHAATTARAHESDPNAETLVVFMCGAALGALARDWIAGGRAPSTPIAIVRAGTWASQEVYVGTLADVVAVDGVPWRDLARDLTRDLTRDPARDAAPSLVVVGNVVTLEQKLHWFGGVRKPIRSTSDRAVGPEAHALP